MLDIQRQISVNAVHGAVDCTRPPDFRFEGESHPFWEVVYVRDGKAGVSADERVYTLTQGDAIFHKPMEFHRIWSLDGTSPKLYIFSFEASGDMTSRLEKLTMKFDEKREKRLDRLISISRRAFELYGDGYLKSVVNEVYAQEFRAQLELFLLSLVSANPQTALPEDTSPETRLFSEIVQYLRENLSRKMSIEQLAEHFFVSPSRIKKLFSKYSGIGVMTYFNNMKMIEAQRLLLEEDTGISETAEMLGFSNQFYFSTVFKKATGLSPGCFKRT